MNGTWIEHEINGMTLMMETDGTTWIDNPERSKTVTVWKHELVALAEFLTRPDVADRLATVRAVLASR